MEKSLDQSRRLFLKKGGLMTLAGLTGMNIVFAENMPEGYRSIIAEEDPFKLFNKHSDMSLLNDKPWNMEAKAHLLDDRVTPEDRMFIRNNGIIPTDIDAKNWTLTVEGESAAQSKTYTIDQLKSQFKHYTYQLTLECGGNGRSEYNPPAKGNQWTIGAIGCAKWTGIRLKDLLKDVGVKNNAIYIGYYGTDKHLSGDQDKVVISRGFPMEKAYQEETLIAFAMNGKDIPLAHGYPLRLVAGGWPASASGKWMNKLVIRNKEHDGPKMTGTAYRVPCETVPPGAKVEEKDMCIIESMPVKSLITYPKSGAVINEGKQLEIRGHAWAGELEVSKMEFSIDFGATWKSCDLERPVNRLAWQHWKANVEFPQKGYYEVWAKAIDSAGKAQPMIVPGWNPKGYLNNASHRIAIKVN
ncbi:MAG: sulfite oxidase [Cyclobacteriaceae bacterium]|jgi:DMSO/TMAO reductase YedYZ molybdopterin-dependent catalytic subunit